MSFSLTGQKVALIGDSGVGKSTILSRLLGDSFSTCYIETRDRVVKSKDIVLGKEKRRQRLQIWDTPGNDDSRTYTTSSLNNVKAAVIVFDVCKESSFMNIQHWIKILKHYVEDEAESVFIIIAANKTDKLEKRIVQPEMIEQLAHQFNVQYIEVSAKTGERIDELFKIIANNLAERATDNEICSQAQPSEESQESVEYSQKKENGFFDNCTIL